MCMQAELLQQEIINRQRLSVATQHLLDDLPKQASAAEERMLMAEYVKGYQLVRTSSSHHFQQWVKLHGSSPASAAYNSKLS